MPVIQPEYGIAVPGTTKNCAPEQYLSNGLDWMHLLDAPETFRCVFHDETDHWREWDRFTLFRHFRSRLRIEFCYDSLAKPGRNDCRTKTGATDLLNAWGGARLLDSGRFLLAFDSTGVLSDFGAALNSRCVDSCRTKDFREGERLSAPRLILSRRSMSAPRDARPRSFESRVAGEAGNASNEALTNEKTANSADTLRTLFDRSGWD